MIRKGGIMILTCVEDRQTKTRRRRIRMAVWHDPAPGSVVKPAYCKLTKTAAAHDAAARYDGDRQGSLRYRAVAGSKRIVGRFSKRLTKVRPK